ncbi:TonB-dependent receptor [Tamlana sp. 2_MG-2023]|uniref:TonB-dependent receptor plug domain-containing protein n=1 Tax=unclassified Tamlana TaxID=2614803 RepID=UPI0026E15DFD|nr:MULTISPECIES: TonB-dependent receptor plug domain-containing protein [unclassified Tamlana]MDO6760468.1 TonB-dependent receptor [Tamlana sp. 2_MG-2023]MDO6790724.1 TonB-dependent receptor [Tamlana sp. 1_MG-2023]
MSLNKNNIFIFFSIILSGFSFAQNIIKDSTAIEKLDEVVITGQYNPQSANKSIFEVKVINRREIEQRAATNLSDLLNQTLNINIVPNTSTGKTGVSLFGLDAQYFKILIDNVPVINEEGMGNNVDLTLINLDDIQSVEIIEGAMGVQYGANAVSGVINIITKKSIREKTRIQIYAQEETVGNEYEWFDKGRHIQSVNISHNFTDDIFGNATYTRNDFAGFWGDKQGKVYDKNDGLRGYEWLPKEQNNAKILLNYKKDRFNIFYKFDYFNESIYKANSTVDLNENAATGTSDPLALDETFFNNRFIHNLNANGLLRNRIDYNISLSYQEQTKDLETYTYRIREDEKLNLKKGEYLSRKALFSRGTFSNLIHSKHYRLQAGYELTNESGYGSPIAITISPDDDAAEQRLDNYDFFASAEIEVSDKFSLRPGTRVSFTNLFDPQYVFSLSSKYLFKNDIELRTVLGSANRTPNYDELYTYFVDVNHNVQGNPDLTPEHGLSAFIHLKKTSKLSNNTRLKNKITASYLGVNDRIELTIVEQNPLSYQYTNIDSFKSFGIASENNLQFNQFNIQLGASLLGTSKILDSNQTPNDDFLFSFQLNSTVSYLIPKWKTSVALYYKHTGEQHQFVEETNAQGEQEYVKGTTEAFDWLDFTLKKSFLDKTLETTLGVNNLFDISSVETDAIPGGAHDSGPELISLAYGRSFFLKLAYNIRLQPRNHQ